MVTALMYNAQAGKGTPARQVMERLCAFFSGDRLLVADRALLFEDLPLEYVPPEPAETGYYNAIAAKVSGLVRSGAQRFVSVGGDGTATYVRNALYELGQNLPMLGVAAGTANVGPIVSVTLDQLEGRHISQARLEPWDGLSVFVDGKFLSLAFNDLIVGDTFLGTIDGQTVNMSVRALLEEGKRQAQKPSPDITGADFLVELNGRPIRPNSKSIAQIIVSSVAGENHYGRAVYGAIGKCDWSEKKGVIALCDYIAVSFDDDGAALDRFSSMDYLIFGPNDRVILQGFTQKACLVCDGNPYLLPCDRFEVRYEPALVKIIKL